MLEGGRSIIQLPQHSNIAMHIECRAELINLVQKDEVPAFLAHYKLRIEYLSQHLGQETLHRQWFEVLKKAKGVRSIRFITFHNLRILYALENDNAYLLLAFKERQGHKNTEYSKYIDPALKRLSEKEKML